MKINKKLPLALLGLSVLLVNPSFANNNPHELSRKCHTISEHLMRLTTNNPHDSCAADVEIAAAYVETAAMNMEHFRRDEALRALDRGQWELETLQSKPQCTYFAPLVKPELAKVILVRTEIDVLLHANA
jgi:hypothetical protein